VAPVEIVRGPSEAGFDAIRKVRILGGGGRQAAMVEFITAPAVEVSNE
jgi:hypothetical protein